MSQIATVELIYLAHSGRQHRAKHKQVHVGWELEDLEQQAKSALSLRDYAIEFVNANGHKQFIMPSELETIIVNVISITEERWEEPAYEEMQQKWSEQLTTPYGVAEAGKQASAPSPEASKIERTSLAVSKVVAVRPKQQTSRSPIQPMTSDGETTRSLRITWPQPGADSETTQPIRIIPGKVAGMSMAAATALIERVAAGGTVTPGL